jgi:hypothetical protein
MENLGLRGAGAGATSYYYIDTLACYTVLLFGHREQVDPFGDCWAFACCRLVGWLVLLYMPFFFETGGWRAVA